MNDRIPDRSAGPSGNAGTDVSKHSVQRRYSLRSSLSGLVAACILPTAVIAGGLVYANYSQMRDRTYLETVLTARYLAADMDRELASMESGLRVLATSPELAAGDLARVHKYATAALDGQIALNYVLVDRQGRQLINTLVPFGGPLPHSERPKQLKDVFEHGITVVTDLFIGGVTRAPILAMGVPVYRDGEVVYSLSIGVTPDRIVRVLQRGRLPEGWVASVLDSTGTIIARTREPQQFVGKRAVEDIVRALEKGREGTIETVTVDGTAAVASFSKLSAANWSVAVRAPKSTLHVQLYGLLAWVGVGLAGAVVGGLWLAAHLAGRVTAAVRGLNDAALSLGNGGPVELPSTSLVEADAVGAALVEAGRLMNRTRYMAQHDPLTGLCNRALFNEMLEHYLSAAVRNRGSLAVLAVDLDDFKQVNDQHGHPAGDRVLKAVADRITKTIRASDVAARTGGDEFVVLLNGADANIAQDLAERLVAALSEPYDVQFPRVSASIGIAVFPLAGTTAESLLERADHALYEAKHAGKRSALMDL